MQVLCGLQVVFFLFNCQTPGFIQSLPACRLIGLCSSLILDYTNYYVLSSTKNI